MRLLHSWSLYLYPKHMCWPQLDQGYSYNTPYCLQLDQRAEFPLSNRCSSATRCSCLLIKICGIFLTKLRSVNQTLSNFWSSLVQPAQLDQK